MTLQLAAFLSRRWCVPASSLEVEVQPLHGGLESVVARARVRSAHTESDIPSDLVVKQLLGPFAREADVYEALWKHLDRPPAVRMFGRQVCGDATYLYLEHAASFSPWPWSDSALAARVCRELAKLHDSPGLSHSTLFWSYDEELLQSAEDTLAFATVARDASGQRPWRRLGDLRRVVKALPEIRRRLLADGESVIHGDMHPGNAILRRAALDDVDVVLIDWARARIGSPLEDIASWLHSLGCWEPQARRRHDTLMRAYLESRRGRRRFDSTMRVDYWFASVSNGLSGAIRYHLTVLADPAAAPEAHVSSRLALKGWQRVVRRAAALLSTNPDR